MSRTLIPDFDDEEVIALLESGKNLHTAKLKAMDKELNSLATCPIASGLLVIAKKEQVALINRDSELIKQFKLFVSCSNDNE